MVAVVSGRDLVGTYLKVEIGLFRLEKKKKWMEGLKEISSNWLRNRRKVMVTVKEENVLGKSWKLCTRSTINFNILERDKVGFSKLFLKWVSDILKY